MEHTQNNYSTIIQGLWTILQPLLIQYGVTQDFFFAVADLIIGIIIFYWSAKNPNTFKALGNKEDDNDYSC